MNVHLRNAVIFFIFVVSLFILAEQTGIIGTDLSTRVLRFLAWPS